MSIPRCWPAWSIHVLSLLLAVAAFFTVLVTITHAEAGAAVVRLPPDAPHLAAAAVGGLDLPDGWRIDESGAGAPWPSEGPARAVWVVRFSSADGQRGKERLLVFASPGQASQWAAAAQARAVARGAQLSACRYQASSATLRRTSGGMLVEQVYLRRGSVVARLTFVRPSPAPPAAPCLEGVQAIVARAARALSRATAAEERRR